MPWSNQGGGGRKPGGNGGPWGGNQGGGGSGKEPPDLDEILRRGQDRVKRVIGGGGGGGGSGGGAFEGGVPTPFLFLLGILALAVLGFFGFFYRVNPDEQGIVLRFGKYHRWEPAGLHFRLPYPIEEVWNPKVTQLRTLTVGGGSRSGATSGPDSSLMLTGDGSVLDVPFVVQWRIKTDTDSSRKQTGVEQYLFNIQNPETTVREVSESAMREVAGRSTLHQLLTGRAGIKSEVQKLIQTILDSYGSGIYIDNVQLGQVDAPGPVIGAFRDVQSADQDKKRFVKEAQTYADQNVPRAKGDADRIVAAAEGFRDQQIAEATGQAARFLKVYEEYRKAPEVTRLRLFLEMQERVLSGADKIIIDQKNGGQSVVPFLPLDQLQKRKSDGGQP